MALLAQVSFTGGEVSPSLAMRVDIARYQTSLKRCYNFFVRPTGGVSNRPGTQYVAEVNEGVLWPFIFSTDQAYLLVATASAVQAYADGAPVGSPVVTSYQLAELPAVRFTQSADVMTLVHELHPPAEYRRLTASSFEYAQIDDFEDGPFLDENTDESIFVYASDVEGVVTLIATSAIFNADHVGALFRLDERDLSDVEPWEPNKFLKRADGPNPDPVIADPYGELRRSDGKVYKCVTHDSIPVQGAATGTVQPTHDKGIAADGDGSTLMNITERAGVEWEYLHSGFGIVRITSFVAGNEVIGTVLRRLPEQVVGGIVLGAGPWTMTGDGVDVTLAIAGATSDDENDYEVLINGVYVAPSGYSVNATTDVLTFTVAPSNGATVSARQLDENNRTNIWSFGAWSEDQGYPSVVTYYQDRLVFAATPEKPQTQWASCTGDYHNFRVSTPIVNDDSIRQTLNARQINKIRELVPLDQLISLTASSSWATPRRKETWTPETVGFDPQAYDGAAALRSVLIGDTALYVQNGQTKLRDLRYQFEVDKFNGNELTVLARHLFKSGKRIVDLDYAREPHGILWIVREDGALVSLTYLREQDVIGWAVHETDGYFEKVCVIPEDGRDVPYFIVRRTIQGATVRYLERLTERDIDDVVDGVFMDCALTFDGRNTTATTVGLNGADYSDGATLTLTASSAVFGTVPDEVRIEREYEDEDGETVTDQVRLEVLSQTSTSVLVVRPIGDVPESLQNVATAEWAAGFDTFSGLSHLQGKEVAILADGAKEEPQTVTGGQVVLQAPAYVVHIGLPYYSEIETLEVNIFGAASVRSRSKNIGNVAIIVQDTVGLSAGRDSDNLYPVKLREDENYDEPTHPFSGCMRAEIVTNWSPGGRVVIRQDAPLPATILAVIPDVDFGGSHAATG